jgi:tetratricopeptide (TPR) repeat protein
MEVIHLEQAVQEIAGAVPKAGNGGPFSFVVGAGISRPTIPSASGIIDDCRKKLAGRKPTDSPPGNPMGDYSYWFEKAYPQPFQRQAYLETRIKNARISAANFRLAHLLHAGAIGRIVVTPNFDDHISRALTLLGTRPIVCDHPQTTMRMDAESTEVQIIHVHGTYRFYDCANLTTEIDGAAHGSDDTSSTMLALLDRIFHKRIPLVLGYSGWEGDVIMRALKRRLETPPPLNLYWFCHREEDRYLLPDWLRNGKNEKCKKIYSEYVKVVVPKEIKSSRGANEPVANTYRQDESLDAAGVLGELVFRTKSPDIELTKNPFGFFAQQLLSINDSAETYDLDEYSLQSVVADIKKAQKTFASVRRSRDGYQSEIKEMRSANRCADFPRVIRHAARISLGKLKNQLLEEVARLTCTAASFLSDNSKKALGYSRTIEACRSLKISAKHRLASCFADALVGLGRARGEQERYDDAIKAYGEVVRRFGRASESNLREQVVRALFNKGCVLGEQNKQGEQKGYGDEIKAYDGVVRRCDKDPVLELRKWWARALVNKGVVLGKQEGRGKEKSWKEAIKACDEVVRRFGDASESILREQVARALYNKGIVLGKLKRYKGAIKAYDEVVRRFDNASELTLRDLVARALYNKGWVFGKQGSLNRQKRYKKAIDAYDEVVRRFGDASELALRGWVANALVNKSGALIKLEHHEDAIESCDKVLRQFGDVSDEVVAGALNAKDEALSELGRKQEAIQAYDELERRFGDDPRPEIRAIVDDARGRNRPSPPQPTRNRRASIPQERSGR